MSNKKTGNDFESEFCDMLYDQGFWSHNFANNHNGQPADVIACKGELAYLIDCKNCATDYFKNSRIEDNQHLAMTLWKERVDTPPLFAIKFEKTGNIYMIRYQNLIESGLKRLSEEDIVKEGGVTYNEWINLVQDYLIS